MVFFRWRFNRLIPFPLLLSLSCASIAAGPGQSADDFDVVAIRPSDPSGSEGSSWRISPDGDLRARGVPLIALLASAFNVRDFQIVGCPKWALSATYDLDARADRSSSGRGVSNDLTALRLKHVLENRFGLRVREGSRKMSAYALVVWKQSSSLRASQMNGDPSPTYIVTPTRLEAKGVTMAELANVLTNQVNKIVVDQTGLPGRFDINLQWSSTELDAGAGGGGSEAARSDDPPQLLTALREQLGLRLEAQRLSIRTIIVENIAPPSPN